MNSPRKLITGAALWVGLAHAFDLGYAPPLYAEEPPGFCKKFNIDVKASRALRTVTSRQNCKVGKRMGLPVPDPGCTPGAINPTVTSAILRDPMFSTHCLRNDAISADEKKTTYKTYGLAEPPINGGANETCELDHLVPLELGGAVTPDNVWPQCGPPGVMLDARYFKEKDKVEEYLAVMVRMGKMDLLGAQKGIASDWTQYSAAARRACPGGMCGK
jgi:hypothetical protein